MDAPSFMIIGVAKAATTWTHHHLQSNPAIYLPDPEPQFFSRNFNRGFEFYSEFFAGAKGRLKGEKSASYFAHPHAARRISQVLPDIPLILQLRNPIERAHSHYKMCYRRGTHRGPPEAHLDPSAKTQSDFLDFGLYAEHLARWHEYFPPSQLKIIFYEELRRSPEATIRAVCQHIGAPEYYDPRLGDSSVNDSNKAFLPLGVRSAMARFKPLARPLRSNGTFQAVRSVFAREIAYPVLSPALRAKMLDFYRPDIEALEGMLGQKLSGWLDSPKETATVAPPISYDPPGPRTAEAEAKSPDM